MKHLDSKKDKRVNIRMPEKDLVAIQKKALADTASCRSMLAPAAVSVNAVI